MAEKYTDLDKQAPIIKLKGDDADENATFLSEMRDRFEKCMEHDRELRLLALEDIKFTFVPGNQWDEYTAKLRVDRPCYEFNKVRQSVRQITGDQLQNRPSGKVRPIEDGDEDIAEIYEGLIRNIESVSHAERAYDGAFNYACAGGYGAWRLTTDYKDDEDFDQDIFVKAIPDPFSVYCDYAAKEFDRRDARFWFVKDRVHKKVFQEKYPDADTDSFFGSDVSADLLPWFDGEYIIIAEYWYKKPTKKTVVQLSDGRVVDLSEFEPQKDALSAQGITEKNRKTINSEQVVMEIVSGTQRLEGPFDWAGKFIPIIPLWGDLINVEGRDIYSGMVRFAKDAQRLFNFEQSTLVELVAKQPQQPLTGPADGIKGYESYYENLSDQDVPFLPYNVIPGAPNGGAPTRVGTAQFPSAWANLSAEASDNIKATLGIYDASLGARSNETSGRAINSRKMQGATANFVYTDNLAKALKYTYEIMVDLIPRIYDTERVLRVLGQDGAKKWVQVNKSMQDPQTGQMATMNDLSQGKYDVTCTAGPSFATQRQELADASQQLMSVPGPFGLMWQYVFAKSSDLPGTDELEEWMRQFLVKQGLAPPDENTPPPPPQQQPPPDPRIEADIQLKTEQARLTAAKTQETLAKTDNTAADTQQTIASLPANVAHTQAQTQEQSAKALRNMQEAHHAEVNHTLQFVNPPIPDYSNHQPMIPPDPTGQNY